MKQYLAKITVRKIENVADPEGKTICSALVRLGYNGIDEVKTGKVFLVRFEAEDYAGAKELIDRISEEILSNPIIENFTFEIWEI